MIRMAFAPNTLSGIASRCLVLFRKREGTAYSYVHSALGVATNETIVVSGTTNVIVRSLDAFSRPAGLEVGRGVPAEPPPYAVAYGYDAETRLATVSNAAFTATYAYANDGWDAGYTVTLTNGLVFSRAIARDPYRRHLVTSITNRVELAAVSSYRYAHDLLDRATSRVDGGTVTNAFAYNPRSEVSSATIATNVCVYAYDPIGNRLAATNNALVTLYACDPLNQYTNIVEGVAPSTPHYDPDGNMVSNAVWSYSWDAENRLVAVYSNATLVISNAYDHASRRVLKVTASSTHTSLYDGWNLVQEVRVQGSVASTRSYFWGKDVSATLQGAGGIGGLLAVSVDGAFFFPLYDHNGNITTYVDEDGSVVAEYLYDAYGGTGFQTGPMAATFAHRFSTKYHDPQTGLYYYGYRFYSPELGRWLNRDPIEEGGGENLYGFVGNRTTAYVDILGRNPSNVDESYPVVSFKDCLRWRYEVQYRYGIWLSLQFRAVDQALPGASPARRYLASGQKRKSDRCLWKSRKLTVWVEPKNGWSVAGGNDICSPLDSMGKLRYEPMVAIVKPGEDTVCRWKRTWSKPGMLQSSGPVVSITGERLTFVDYVWGEDTRRLELEVHRKIDRLYLEPYNNVAEDDWDEELETLRFRLENSIGDPPPNATQSNQ
jgi:RHS repeat-associated protein